MLFFITPAQTFKGIGYSLMAAIDNPCKVLFDLIEGYVALSLNKFIKLLKMFIVKSRPSTNVLILGFYSSKLISLID
jgi:hypothetical protein